MNERHPDRESYLYICNELIEKEICNYCDVYKDSLELIPNWKEAISVYRKCYTHRMQDWFLPSGNQQQFRQHNS